MCKCGNHPLHCPLDFLLNCAGQRNASTHSRAPLILLDLLEIYFPHMWEVLGGWVGVAGRAREIVLATVYRLSLFVLWFKNCTFWQHLFMYPIVQLRSVLLPFVRDAWQLLPLTAGRAQAQAQAHGSRIRHLPLARVLNASPWCHCVCSSCSCCLLVVGCRLFVALLVGWQSFPHKSKDESNLEIWVWFGFVAATTSSSLKPFNSHFRLV